MKNKEVSVVIPICIPKREFIKVINRLLKQTVLPKEIILINSKKYFDGSTLIINDIEEKFNNIVSVKRMNEESKNTKEIKDDRIPIYVYDITPEEFDHGATRHMGINVATSEYVLIMTQDAIPNDKELIEKLLDKMETDVSVSYAKQLPRKNCSFIEKYTRSFNYGDEVVVKNEESIETMGIKAIFCSDVCAMYNKSLYMEVGGFPARCIFNEDAILAYKAITNGYKVVYAADAKVIHSHNYSLVQEFKRNFDLGVSHSQYAYIFNNLSSENEGIKLVENTTAYLLSKGKAYLIPSLILHSGFKYAGYRVGKMYTKLPKAMIIKCSMNEKYWKRGLTC